MLAVKFFQHLFCRCAVLPWIGVLDMPVMVTNPIVKSSFTIGSVYTLGIFKFLPRGRARVLADNQAGGGG